MRKLFWAALVAAAFVAGFQPVPQSARANSFSAVPAVCANASPMERSVFDDETFVYDWFGDHKVWMQEVASACITTLRIQFIHQPGDEPPAGELGLDAHATLAQYVSAIDDAQKYGLKVELDLVWQDQNDPAEIAKWAGKVTYYFRGRTLRYSILNEPDLNLQTADSCDPKTLQNMIKEGVFAVKRVRVSIYKRIPRFRGKRYKRVSRKVHGRRKVVYKRSRRGAYRRAGHHRFRRIPRFRGWRYKRVAVQTSTGKPVFVYRRARKGRYRRLRVWRQVAVSGVATHEQDSISVQGGCERILQGQLYRRIVLATVKAIKTADPNAEVAAGDISPNAGCLLFTNVATSGGLPIVEWLVHAYDKYECGIYNYGAVRQAANGLAIGYDEFGYQLGWPDRANALRSAWRQAAADGVTQMNQNGINNPLNGGSWNTSLGGNLGLLVYILQP